MQTDTRTLFATHPSLVAAGLFAFALFQSIEQLARAGIGRNDLFSDAANVWLPLSQDSGTGVNVINSATNTYLNITRA